MNPLASLFSLILYLNKPEKQQKKSHLKEEKETLDHTFFYVKRV